MPGTITLDTTVFGAGQLYKGFSDLEEEIEVFGTEHFSPRGDLTLIESGQKLRWTITWDKIPKTTRDAVRALSRLSRTFTFIDPDGVSYTVQCPQQGRYKSGIGINGADNTKLYYGVTLVIWEV
jgi:hypothetical protein